MVGGSGELVVSSCILAGLSDLLSLFVGILLHRAILSFDVLHFTEIVHYSVRSTFTRPTFFASRSTNSRYIFGVKKRFSQIDNIGYCGDTDHCAQRHQNYLSLCRKKLPANLQLSIRPLPMEAPKELLQHAQELIRDVR